jgi:hypothetical protein
LKARSGGFFFGLSIKQAVKGRLLACHLSRRKVGSETGIPSHALVDHPTNPPLNLRYRQGFHFGARLFLLVKEQGAVGLAAWERR